MIATQQGGAADAGIDWLDAVVLGIVEGLTEFLPVSSTGHLIVAQRMLGVGSGEAENAFAIAIQIGAITAILVLYWRRLLASTRTMFKPQAGQPNLVWQIAVAAVPAVVVGLLFGDLIDEYLFSARVVAITLLVGGVLLLWLERHQRGQQAKVDELPAMSYRIAFYIGLFQCLALIPGTSRSGATIGGALLVGLSRTAAAEFSFLVGLPILYGASCYKMIQVRDTLTGPMLVPLLIGTAVSFVAAIAVVGPFLRFIRRNDFQPFAWYRIVAGAALLACIAAGWL